MFNLWYNIYIQSNRKVWMRCSEISPLVHKEGCPMDTMEILTLVLIIFAILSFLDNRYDPDNNNQKK